MDGLPGAAVWICFDITLPHATKLSSTSVFPSCVNCNSKFDLSPYRGISPLIYNDTGTVSGDFGGLVFESGYLTSYSLKADPDKIASVAIQINFFDHLTGDFDPITGEKTVRRRGIKL